MTMSLKHTLFTSVLALSSAAYSPASLSDQGEVEADVNNKPTNVTLDSTPPISVTCYRCEELARKYLSSQMKGIQPRIIQESEEAE